MTPQTLAAEKCAALAHNFRRGILTVIELKYVECRDDAGADTGERQVVIRYRLPRLSSNAIPERP